MSHFTILVAANSRDDLDAKMLPYHEYGWGDDVDDQEYLEFKDETEETLNWWREAAQNGKTFGGVMSDHWKQEHPDLINVQLEACKAAEYEREHGDTTEHPDQPGTFGYWYNPNAKWDWYSVGGRWSGLLKIKENVGFNVWTGNGEGGVFNAANHDPTRADYTLAGLVDWDAILDAQIEDKLKEYRAFHDAAAQIADNQGDCKDVEEKARALYHQYDEQGKNCRMVFKREIDYIRASIIAHIARRAKTGHYFFCTFDELAQIYYSTEDEYRAAFSAQALTYAFIDEKGNWSARGEMGWFGMDSDHDADYDETFWKFVRSLPADQPVYVVDAHI